MSTLKYSLDDGVKGQIKFQVLEQSNDVTKFFDFLGRLGKNSFLTKAGYKIAQSKFPEFKISENTIYLRGSLTSLNNKVDVTRVPEPTQYKVGTIKMIKEALAEFVSEVQKAKNAGLLDNYSVYSVYGTPNRDGNPLAGMNTTKRAYTAPAPIIDWICRPANTVSNSRVYFDSCPYMRANPVQSNVVYISL